VREQNRTPDEVEMAPDSTAGSRNPHADVEIILTSRDGVLRADQRGDREQSVLVAERARRSREVKTGLKNWTGPKSSRV
jgi:hypothetical protein